MHSHQSDDADDAGKMIILVTLTTFTYLRLTFCELATSRRKRKISKNNTSDAGFELFYCSSNRNTHMWVNMNEVKSGINTNKTYSRQNIHTELNRKKKHNRNKERKQRHCIYAVVVVDAEAWWSEIGPNRKRLLNQLKQWIDVQYAFTKHYIGIFIRQLAYKSETNRNDGTGIIKHW